MWNNKPGNQLAPQAHGQQEDGCRKLPCTNARKLGDDWSGFGPLSDHGSLQRTPSLRWGKPGGRCALLWADPSLPGRHSHALCGLLRCHVYDFVHSDDLCARWIFERLDEQSRLVRGNSQPLLHFEREFMGLGSLVARSDTPWDLRARLLRPSLGACLVDRLVLPQDQKLDQQLPDDGGCGCWTRRTLREPQLEGEPAAT